MPGLPSNQVTLSEVVEVRGGPLCEDEIWALIYEACDTVKDIFLTGNKNHLHDILRTLCLENIFLCGSGKVRFGTEVQDEMILDRRFVPPERYIFRDEEISDLGIEKMIIYALGMIMYAATEFGNPSVAELCLSSELETLLLYMCEDDPSCRCNLVQVFQACNSTKGIYLSVERIKSMVASILGSDLPLDDSPVGSEKLSMTSSILKTFSPLRDYTTPVPVGPLRALTPLSTTRVDETARIEGFGSDDNFPRRDTLGSPARSLVRTYKSIDNADSGETYEPLRKKPEIEPKGKTVGMAARAPVKEDSMKRARANASEEALDRLPPVGKISSLPRDHSKSSTYSTPDFKRLIATEKRKLAKDGFFDEERSKIKVVDTRYKSMPTLNSVDSESPRSGKESIRSAEYQYGHPQGNYRKLTRFASKDSMDSASLAASQYSSALSLNYGSYTLNSHNGAAIQRPLSLYGGSSNDGSTFNGLGSFSRTKDNRVAGPEFIIIPHDVELSVVNITPPRLGPVSRGRRKISVMLPNAQRLDTTVESTAIAKDVFDQITSHLGLKETVYFGLTQIKDSEHIFLKLESKLTKYAPSGWKDDKKNKIDFILHFKVKFFVANIDYLRHYKTRHLFYLQLRREILCGYIFCHDEAATSLASLALQAEYNDYVEQYHGISYFEADHYLPGKMLSRMSRSDIYHRLPLLHHSYRGLREDEAELRFLKEAQRLKEYGMLFYHVSRSKKDLGDSILLGICVKGIVLYEVRGQMKTEIHRQFWHMIEKFSFSRKKFVVEPKKGLGLQTLALYTNSYKKAKYLLKMCESFHLFSKYIRPRSIQSENASSIGSMKSSHSGERVDPHKENQAPNGSRGSSVTSANAPATASWAYNTATQSEPQKTTSPVYDERVESKPPAPAVQRRQKGDPRHLENDVADNEEAEMLENFSPRTRRRLSTLRGVPEKRISVVMLNRKMGQGLGITIVGGEDSKRIGNGIFIKSILAEGVAAKDGTLQKGDRILSVNGKSLEQVTHDEAAGILKNAYGDVQLIVSQFTAEGASFLDKTGLSTLDEGNFSPNPGSPATVSNKGFFGTTKVQRALTLSPIAKETTEDAKGLKEEIKKTNVANDGKKLVRGKVIVNEEIEVAQEVAFEESEQMNLEKMQSLSSTPSIETKSSSKSARAKRGRRSDDGSQPNLDLMQISLTKRTNSFGMTITGGAGSGFPSPNIYVQSIDTDGPVSEDGRIQVGDCLLQVNGIDIRRVSHKQAVEVLKKAPTESTLLISKSLALRPDHFETYEEPLLHSPMTSNQSSRSNSVANDKFLVEIDKGMGGLGLSLAGGYGSSPEFKGRIMVRRLFPGQPAAGSGKLRIGDVIVAVNGTKVTGFTQQEAINMLRREKSTIRLHVKRPHPNDIPEELLVETPRESLDPKSVLENIQRKMSISATRQMPEAPVSLKDSDDEPASTLSASRRNYSTDGEEIDPYSESFQQAEPEAALEKFQNSKRLSTHEVLVHAQISGSRPKPTRSGSDCSPVDEARNQMEEVSEHQSDLSLPELPSSNDVGLKLPDFYCTNELENALVNQDLEPELHTADQLSRTSSTRDQSKDMLVSSNHSGRGDEITERMGNPSLGETPLTVARGDSFDSSIDLRSLKSEASSIASEPVGEAVIEVIREQSVKVSADDAQRSLKAQQNSFEYFEVSLTKGTAGLGFTLAGGKSTTGGCFIREIVSDPAKSCGKLQSSDQIVMVDSIDVGHFEHMDAVEILRGTSNVVKLGIKRQLKVEKPRAYGFEMITLNRNQRGRIGLILGEENGEIIVEDTVEGEPASLTGGLRHGDKIKEINDIPLQGMTLNDANTILEEATPIVQLAVERRKQVVRESRYAVGSASKPSPLIVDRTETMDSHVSPKQARKMSGEGMKSLLPYTRSDSIRSDSSVSSSPKKSSITNSPVLKKLDIMKGQGVRLRKTSSQEEKGEIILVRLEKGSSGLGMSLTGNNDFGDATGAFIANINPDGVAQRAGKLRAGDKIISINGEHVENKQQKEVVAVLRKVSGEISLEVFRHPAKRWFGAHSSSFASSNHSDDLDLDFHLTEDLQPTDHSEISDRLLSLIPTCDEEHAQTEQIIDSKIMNLDINLHNSPMETVNQTTEKPKTDSGFEITDSAKDFKLTTETFGSENDTHEVSKGFENEEILNRIRQDLSWNDSDLSDEEHFNSVEDVSNLGPAKIEKSSISTSDIARSSSLEKSSNEKSSYDKSSYEISSNEISSNDVTVPEASVSFSSTFEKITPSSSIVSSMLDEISPVNTDDEDSDFELSSSMIPDLSSFNIEDQEAFEKYFGQKEKAKISDKTQDVENSDDVAYEVVDCKEVTNDAPKIDKQNSSSSFDKSIVNYSTPDRTEQTRSILNSDKEMKNQESIDSGHVTQIRGSFDRNSESSWKEEDNDESIDDEDNPFMEADSLDIEMALEEFEMRKKEEFNDTLRDQIKKEELEHETSFVKQPQKGNLSQNSNDFANENSNDSSGAKNSPQIESRIPKLDPKKMTIAACQPRKSPGRSGIPVFSPPRSPSKMSANFEMKDRTYNTDNSERSSHMETSFVNENLPEFEKDEAVIDTGGMQIDLDSDSDLSFDSDDEITINLTGDTLSNGHDQIDVHIARYQSILESERIDREFQEVKDVKSTDTCDVARRSANRDKNRFRSILPFDKTRVCLAGGEESDYINASHIKVQANGKSFSYIAAQGPLSNTIDEFWRLIWEQRIETVIMLTKDVEGGKAKCHRYWPDLPGLGIKAADRFKIDLLHRKESGNLIERQFSLLNTKLNKSVAVNHLLFNAWPETGVPREPLPFLMFVKYSMEIHSTGPLLVHCSAGTGRTGLFIITDILNKLVSTEQNFDILDLVKSLKRQRQSLIQTKDQYMFCYKMAIEILREEKHLTY